MSGQDEEAEERRRVFREAMRDVKRLTAQDRAQPPVPPRRRVRLRRDPLTVLRESTGAPLDPDIGATDALAWRRDGQRPDVLRALRRGRWPVEDEIDLHGLDATAARGELRDFLAAALARGLRCVRVIHGKGLRSGERGPVLKRAVAGQLQHTGAVLAYVSAPAARGGTGAVHVLLSH